MKKTLFILLALTCFLDIRAQQKANNAYYVAQFLLSQYTVSNTNPKKIPLDDDMKTIIANVTGIKAPVTVALLNQNKFFENLFEDASGSGASSFTTKALTSIGGLDVTKFANALADLMIERAKQELTVAFFDRFKKFSEKNPEFAILFPVTASNLANLLSFSYPQMLPALRSGFFKDIGEITYRLDDVLELPRYQNLLEKFPEVRIAIRSLRLIHDLETEKSTAADIIKEFAAFEDWNKSGSAAFKNMASTLKLAAIFSEGLRYEDNTRIWVSGQELKELVTDEIFIRLFMGIICEQVKIAGLKIYPDPKNLSTTIGLETLLENRSEELIIFETKLVEFTAIGDKVINAHAEIKNKIRNVEKVSNEEIFNYINVSIDAIDYSFSLVKVFKEDLVTDGYLALARKSNDLFRSIYSEQYTQAVNNAVDILSAVNELSKNNPSSIAAGKKDEAKKLLGKFGTFVEKVKPYALLMANVVEANSEEEIKAALENVVLPVGSSSIKKYTRCNIAIQSYLGAFLTTSSVSQNSVSGTWSSRWGVVAPIGISWTPLILSWQKAGSVSFFGALLDLGAIVDYRLQKEQDPSSADPDATIISKEYKVQLGQLFSPGLYAVYGFGGNLPLSLAFGGQYGPGLSKIKTDNSTVVDNPSWRYGFFLAVDLPFFNLVNKPQRTTLQ